jgi:DNA-binding response OmpR family regulator
MPSSRPESLRSAIQIFVAEEDEALRGNVASALRGESYEVLECADGATLFRQLERRLARPGARRSVVIAQGRLPGFGALQILHSLRGLDVSIPLILMTRLGDPAIAEVAAKAGASAVLVKPIKLSDLCCVVTELVNRMPAQPQSEGLAPTQDGASH